MHGVNHLDTLNPQEEGTLIGAAFGMCFSYWLGASVCVWFTAYICNINIAILQVLSMLVSCQIYLSFIKDCLLLDG